MVTVRRVMAAVVVLGTACGPSASNDAYERTTHACAPGVCPEAGAATTADAAGGNEPLEPWPDTNAGLVSGVYALHAVVMASVVDVPVDLQLLYRLRILQETAGGGTIMQSTTLCALKLPSVKGIATLTIPPRLDTVIQEASTVVSQGNYLGASGTSQTYTPPPMLIVIGARLKNPATDPLPSLMSVAGEWDEDDDGHPGVTVDATVFTCAGPEQLYVAIRTGSSLTGTFSGFDAIDGTLTVSESESVVGYSDPCLAAAAEINPKYMPTTPFHAQRLADEAALHAQGNVTCDDIIAQAPKLYGSAWTE